MSLDFGRIPGGTARRPRARSPNVGMPELRGLADSRAQPQTMWAGPTPVARATAVGRSRTHDGYSMT